MGSLATGLFDLFSGDPTKQEQNQFGDLGNYESNTGQKATNAAQGYYSGILSGDPSQIAQELAPEIKAGQQQLEQQNLTNAQFGNRGGGTNASTQAGQSQERGNIISLIGQARQNAAGAEAGLGTNLLQQSTGNIANEANLAAQNQQRLGSDVGGIVNGAAQIATGFMYPMAAAGGDAIPSIGTTAAQVTPGADFGPPAGSLVAPNMGSEV
ncbi:MAG: hypothetical protein KGL39_19190, partial [Patescibacteria group bacterium]|nr:hypothetical protein [Patescibacteria group bacterium]